MAERKKHPGGRPRGSGKKTPELCSEIVDRLSEGEPLAQICRDLGIGVSTVWDWEQGDREFSERIARARDIGADAIANRARETARGRGDSTDDVQRDKLIVETDLKLLAKWNPRRYGDRQQVDIAGELTHKRGELSPAERQAELLKLLEDPQVLQLVKQAGILIPKL